MYIGLYSQTVDYQWQHGFLIGFNLDSKRTRPGGVMWSSAAFFFNLTLRLKICRFLFVRFVAYVSTCKYDIGSSKLGADVIGMISILIINFRIDYDMACVSSGVVSSALISWRILHLLAPEQRYMRVHILTQSITYHIIQNYAENHRFWYVIPNTSATNATRYKIIIKRFE